MLVLDHLSECKFQQRRNATEGYKDFCEGTVSDGTCRRWLEKFKTDFFYLFDMLINAYEC